MKTIIRTKRSYKDVTDGGKSLILFFGDLVQIPRLGEYVTVWDGWATHRVEEIWHDIENNCITIVLNTMPCAEFEEEIKKRGIKQSYM